MAESAEVASLTEGPDSRRAWHTAAAAFTTGFVVFGVIYGFGVFATPLMAAFGATPSAVSAFFAIASLSFYSLGPVSGRMSDRYGPRPVVGLGALAMGAGLCLTASIEQLWLGYLTYGFGVGFGAACVYVPTLANVGGWFVRRRELALGIAASGTGFGMLVVPPVSALLIETLGWRAAYILLGLASAALLSVCSLIVSPAPLAPARKQPHRLRRLLRSPVFLMMYTSWVLATTALFVPLLFLPAVALAHGADHLAASALLSVIGGASVLGRLGIGPLASWMGTVSLFKLAVAVMAASHILWIAWPTYWTLVVFATILGFAYGVRISLVPAVLIELFGLDDFGAVLGLFLTGTGIAAVVGPLLAGAAVDLTGNHHLSTVLALTLAVLGWLAILRLEGLPAPE